MEEQIRMLSPEEAAALAGLSVTINGFGLDGMSFVLESGETILIYPCFVCGGPGAHLNIAEVDPSIVVRPGSDIESA
jgi:hypothetical protein